jgi:hypothetical protein
MKELLEKAPSYMQALWDSSMAALSILQEQVRTEMSHGNWRNIPWPVMQLFMWSLYPSARWAAENDPETAEAKTAEVVEMANWLKRQHGDDAAELWASLIAEISADHRFYEVLMSKGLVIA